MLLAMSIAGAVGLVVGGISASVADLFPKYRTRLLEWGGSLLVGGVALLGLSFPMI